MHKEILVPLNELKSIEVTCPHCGVKFCFDMHAKQFTGVPSTCARCNRDWFPGQGKPLLLANFRDAVSQLDSLRACFRIGGPPDLISQITTMAEGD